MNSKINFGESLSGILIERNITVQSLSTAINVSVSTVYDWKNGTQEIKLSNLITLADYLEVSISYLIGISDDDRKETKKQCPQFGKRLRSLFKDKGISTYYLRKNYKYGSKHFENWDKGADPFLSTLIELSEILDCSIDYLIGRI